MTVRGAVLVSVALVGVACDQANPTPSIAMAADTPPAQASAQAPINVSRRTAITEAVARVAPSVVTVQVETRERVAADIFEQFFGGRSGVRRSASIGSGFVVRENGIVITNAHVVSGATSVSVALRDGTSYTATVVGADEINDIAVLRIDARNLPVAPLGNSDDAIVGEWAIAIGNPFGFVLGNSEPSVTAGVISGTGRHLIAGAEGGGASWDMLQTDAAINPGNSGGPLINALGEVIGVNTVIYTPSAGSVGLGFAVPINRVKRVMEDLLADGVVRRPWDGIMLRVPESTNPRDIIASGAVIADVVDGSPAARAGLRPGDQIIQAGGRRVASYFDWESRKLDMRVGEEIPVRVRRGNRELEVRLRITDRPDVGAPKVQVLQEMELVTLTPAIRAQYGARSARGAAVFNVSERIARQLGIQRGDVITRINQAVIEDAEDAATALDYYAGRGLIRMILERRGTLFAREFYIR